MRTFRIGNNEVQVDARRDFINETGDEKYLNILKIQYQRYIIHEKKRSIGSV